MKIIDLSKTVYQNKQEPFYMRVKIKHKPHKKSIFLIKYLLGLPKKLLGDFKGWADDSFCMGVHAVTHIDAPYHYGESIGGKKAKTIDEMPLELGFAEGIIVDLSHKKDNEEVQLAEVKSIIEDNNLSIKENTIVLFRTGRDRYIGTKEYPERGVGLSAEVVEFFIKQGVKVMGIDQWGFDMPLKEMARRAKQLNDSNFFWQAHRVGLKYEYYHMEQLVNLDKLPLTGFKVIVFPLKILGASAAPARVVAIIE